LRENLALPNFKKSVSLFLPFIIWTALTSFWSFKPVYTLERSIYLAVLIISLFVIVWKTKNSYIKLLDIFYLAGFIIIAASLVSLLFNVPADSWSGGNVKGFMGFSSHQNTLASIFVFILPAFNYKLFSEYKSLKETRSDLNSFSGILKKLISAKIIFLLILNLGGLVLLIITFSRASIFSYFIFLSILIFGLYGIRTYLLTCLTFIFLIAITYQFPGINNYYKYLIFKGDATIGASRYALIDASIKASHSGGIIGLGYGISD